ncbi:DNA-3-methyladenine glycosylase I [Acinetobacter qingfengensis]|uniref:DNA-3-methyladenine glycosidase n=1 Tax=Acinetobacter qingfengensis TaxID=1262585 RepID=A0A1E7RFA1_9GAMM|nr:DNA-3-methyladenine glycosylase I [Acinetobacter qingfengensis]KAA8735634.1 DNA-3-methyladenine glycosylase I [Acinetobacter qingfengensis]OEY97917.1 DNA-3-methyladenine glycosidase [Acinetobacter qingfengensis]
MKQRCGWCSDDPIYQSYHDHEWGKPLYNEHALFELLCLEGQQAGLSWITVLKKRECYREHFFQYSINDIANITDQQLISKLTDSGLIRHLGKLKAIRDNALAWQALKQEVGDVTQWLWQFVNHIPQNNLIEDYRQAPAQTEISQMMSKTLKKQGFKFVGPTICYAFMQACGMVNDHENHCSFKKVNTIHTI